MQHQPDPLLQARAGCAPSVVQAVRAELLRQRWPAQVSFTDGVLRIRLLASFERRLLFPQVTTARIFHLVKRLQIPHFIKWKFKRYGDRNCSGNGTCACNRILGKDPRSMGGLCRWLLG